MMIKAVDKRHGQCERWKRGSLNGLKPSILNNIPSVPSPRRMSEESLPFSLSIVFRATSRNDEEFSLRLFRGCFLEFCFKSFFFGLRFEMLLFAVLVFEQTALVL